jgi:hypothetical protein
MMRCRYKGNTALQTFDEAEVWEMRLKRCQMTAEHGEHN